MSSFPVSLFSAFSRPTILVAASLLLLAACGHVPLTTMVKLRNFDLLKTDPDGLRVAIIYPDSIKVPEGGARMMLSVRTKASDMVLLEEEVAFEELGPVADNAEFSTNLKPGMRVGIHRIPEKNTPFFKSFQKFMLDKSEAERDKLEGTMSVSVSGCQVAEVLPEKILVSTYLKTAELGSYVPLLRDVDLAELTAEAETQTDPGLQPCAGENVPHTN